MTLKSLIQRLLDSRTTPSEAGHSAMPSSSYITPTATAVQAWGQMAQGVAPFDGFVRASARASNTSSNIRVTNDTATVFAQSEGTATGQTQGVFVPVAKGDSWTVYGTNRDNVVVRLVKTIGGGYNRFVQRAVLCLKPLSNYLPRSFCKAKSSGSAAKPSLNRELSLVVRQEAMLHQRMDTSVSSILAVPEAICFLTLMQELLRVRRLQIAVSEIVGYFIATLSWAPLSLLKKGCQSILRPIQSQSRFGSVRQRVGVNLSTGGALC